MHSRGTSTPSGTKTGRGTAGRLDDGMARGMELVLTPTLFGLAGFAADRMLGLLPVLTIAFALFGVVGMGIRAYYRYDAQMRLQEEAGPWAAPAGAASIAPVPRRVDDEPAFNIADAYLAAMSRSAT